MKTKPSKKSLILLIAVIAVAAALCGTGVAFAVWSRNPTAEKNVDVPIDEYNPSEKYIIFKGLDSLERFTDNSSATVAYAAVGYDGLVDEVVIPSTHEGKPVTKIAVCEGEISKRFSGNPKITSLFIPESVKEITAGACSDMLLLNKVTIAGSDTIVIGNLAFANCPCLLGITTSRVINGSNYIS